MSGGPVNSHLDTAIHAAVGGFPTSTRLASGGAGAGPALAIKYIPTRFAAAYRGPGGRLKISDTPGFTWGRGTYVTPLAFPLSTAIFGRVGVVAEFDPDGWRVFDATVPAHQKLYLTWLQAQPLYRRFALSAQSAYLSQLLRDQFRRRYLVDCVLFRPDQSNPRYTNTAADVWMAVTDWTPGHGIATGYSNRFTAARLTVVLEEEFEDSMGGIHRTALLSLTSSRPAGNLAARLAQAYHAQQIVRISS